MLPLPSLGTLTNSDVISERFRLNKIKSDEKVFGTKKAIEAAAATKECRKTIGQSNKADQLVRSKSPTTSPEKPTTQPQASFGAGMS